MAEDKDILAKQVAFAHPLFVPNDFKAWLKDYALRVSSDFYSQDIQGLRGARWKSAPPLIDPDVCNITVDWGDCVTFIGPTLTGLSDGTWLFLWGFAALDSFSHSTVIFINNDYADGRGVPGNHALNESFTTRGGSTMNAAVWTIDSHTLSPGGVEPLGTGNNNNQADVKYNVGTAGARFEKRWMHAIRVDKVAKVVE